MHFNLKLSVFIILIVFSCKTVKQTNSQVVPFYINDFFEKENIGHISFVLNEKEDKVLCSNYAKNDRLISYSVYDLVTKSLLYSNQAIGDGVEWHSSEEIAIIGTSRTEPKSRIIINVLTKEVVN